MIYGVKSFLQIDENHSGHVKTNKQMLKRIAFVKMNKR